MNKACLILNDANECIAYLNMDLIIDLTLCFILLWGIKEMFILIIKFTLNR